MTDETVDELAEEKARAYARSDRPDLLDAYDWPNQLAPEHAALARAAPRSAKRWTVQGGDWSHYQGSGLDVGRLGVSFGWFKATEGGGTDATYAGNRSRAGGVHTHGYAFLHPGENVNSAIDHFRDVAGPVNDGDGFPMLDIEVPGFTPQMVAAYRARSLFRFGVEPAIYIATSLYLIPGMASACRGCLIIIPRYGGQPSVDCHVWQNSDKGPGGGDSDVTTDLSLVVARGHANPTPTPDPTPAPPQEPDMTPEEHQLLVDIRGATERLERRSSRQVSRPNGVVYVVSGGTRVWIESEAVRLNLAAAFEWGAPEQWADRDIDALTLVGPEAPGVPAA